MRISLTNEQLAGLVLEGARYLLTRRPLLAGEPSAGEDI